MSLYTVIACKTGYYYNTGLAKCQLCTLSYCTLCFNATTCNTCDTSVFAKKYSTDGKCYLCNINKCTECSANNVCHTC